MEATSQHTDKSSSIPANSTVYINNIDDRIKIPELKLALHEIFDEYGTVLEIIAHKSLRCRGQAFVVFDNVESATTAIEEVNKFELFDKPMALAYARTRSDVHTLREEGSTALETIKQERHAEKVRIKAQQALEAAQRQKRKLEAEAKDDSPQPSKVIVRGAGLQPTKVKPSSKSDEFLAPNKVLFIQGIPEELDQADLESRFSCFAGFKELRTVPARKNIAFVEYENEEFAITAKKATHNTSVLGQTMRVTYRKE
ncbi:U1 small nuclear ribonucleoprotein [Penicillium taxi]|uniref:U1 small nuclear ribonucleoprotein n=1 Tax=Penicillium taxi TaxID=168475 RepID=UPI002544FD40|nr:U1 small nuclear ribonucleoprotein [Penicillium taxi]KAJ5893514.1 U1 small nuclear ribonucleoprotein [Penicillium taxi]